MLKPFKVNQDVLIKMAAVSKFMNRQSRIFAGDILVPPLPCTVKTLRVYGKRPGNWLLGPLPKKKQKNTGC